MNIPSQKASDSQKKPHQNLPPDLAEQLGGELDLAAVRAVARHDLDHNGHYCSGVLILTGDRLGHFLQQKTKWEGEWFPLSDFTAAILVEGVGMGLLRILEGETLAAEYRFTLRYAREMSRLHRLLEQHVEKKDKRDEEPFPPPHDRKKIRCEKCDRIIPPWSEVCPVCLSRKKVLTRMLGFVRPHKWSAAAGLLLAFLGALAGLIRPYLAQPMMDDGLGMAKGHHADYHLLVIYIAWMAGLLIFSAVAGAVQQQVMSKLGSRVARDIRDKTYAHLHKLSLSFFSKKPTGSLVARVTSDSDRIWDFVAMTILELLMALFTVVGVGVALFILNWKLAIVTLMPIPLLLFLMVIFHKKLHSGFERLFHKWSVLTATVADVLPGVRVVKAFSQEDKEVAHFSRKNREYYEDEVDMFSMLAMFAPLTQFCSQIGTILVWLVGGYWVVQGRMTAGTLVAFVSYMWMFYGPIHMIAHMDRMFNRAATSVHRIFEILDTEPTIFSQPGSRSVETLSGRIELRHVSFSYDGIRKVLQNVSLAIEPGEMIGLAGPSGGGKTTLVNLLCRFYDVAEGQVLIDGADIKEYEVDSLRRRIGVVLQEPFLFHGTISANIAYGKPEAGQEEIIAASRAANAHEFILRFPDGYDTIVGERGHTLSGGERQRISIARAILNNPAILILDEATSSVDTETEKLIQEALDRLTHKRTTIAIAHRLSTLLKANRLVILDKGKIVEQGTHEELKDMESGTYAKLLRMQSRMQSVIAIK